MRSVKRIVALILICLTVFFAFAGCSSKGKPLLTLNDNEISVNLFELYLSRMKGMLCTAAYLGNSATKDSFWDTWMDLYDNTTYNEYYTDIVLESVKSYLAALELFDERGLKLPDSYIDEIDAEMEKLVEDQADGSKTAFNAIIGEYGVNYDMLREAYIIEAKIDYLEDDLFGADGSKIGTNIIDQYYTENYARFKQVFLSSYEYVYVTDRNGDVMYFLENGKISYDTTKTAKTNPDGKYVADENGDRVYVYTDENGKERIAYKTEGASKEYQLDSSGNPVLKYYNDTEMEVLTGQANEILSKTAKGDTINFDVLVSKYNEDDGAKDYPDGYYVTQNTSYRSPEIIEAVFNMEVGEVKMLKTDYGIHIIMRYELEKGAYADDKYKDLFIANSTGTYIFMDSLKGELLANYLKPYKEKIEIDEELYATVDIKRAGINYYY